MKRILLLLAILSFFQPLIYSNILENNLDIQNLIKQGIKESNKCDTFNVSILKRDYGCVQNEKGTISCATRNMGEASCTKADNGRFIPKIPNKHVKHPGYFVLAKHSTKNFDSLLEWHKKQVTEMEIKKGYTDIKEYACKYGKILRIKGNDSYLLVKATPTYFFVLLDNAKTKEQITPSEEKAVIKEMCATDYLYFINNRKTFNGILVPNEIQENMPEAQNNTPTTKENVVLTKILGPSFYQLESQHNVARYTNKEKTKEFRIFFDNKDKSSFLKTLQSNFDATFNKTSICSNNVVIFETASNGLYQAFILHQGAIGVLAENYANVSEEFLFSATKQLELCNLDLAKIK